MDCLSDVGKTVKLILENGCTQPLLLNKNAKQECADQECDGNKDDDDDNDDEYSKKNRKPVNSIISAYQLLTPSVKVLLYILTFLALVHFSCIPLLEFLIPWQSALV